MYNFVCSSIAFVCGASCITGLVLFVLTLVKVVNVGFWICFCLAITPPVGVCMLSIVILVILIRKWRRKGIKDKVRET